MLNNATSKIRKLISSSTFRIDDVDIFSTACCIYEVDILAMASGLLRHDKSHCIHVGLLRVGASIPIMAQLPTVGVDGKATLLLRPLPWMLPWMLLLLRWLPVMLISAGILLPAFDSTPLPLPIYESWRLAGVTIVQSFAK